MDKTQWAREYFKNDPYSVGENGIFIEKAAEHFSVCSMRLLPRHKNAAGLVMGGVSFTLADFAFAVAANSESEAAVTLSANIVYLRPARGEALKAEAVCQSDNRTACTYIVKVADESGEVAVMTAVGHKRERNSVGGV